MPATTPTVSTYHVTIGLEPEGAVSREEIEEFTLQVEQVLVDRGYDEHFGASASCVFEPATVEIDLLIDAVSASLVNRRVSEVMAELEARLPVTGLRDQQIAEERTDTPAVCA